MKGKLNKLPIANEAFVYIFILAAGSIILYFVSIILFIASILVMLFIVFFFRNPERKIPGDNSLIVSPADGTVMSVEEVIENEFMCCRAIKVSIFLSLLNIHINRSPIGGVVTYIKYRPGKFLPAFKSHASDINERNSVGIENSTVKVLVHQITGFIARRIVCRVKVGSSIEKGQRFGMIKFGSRTEIILPYTVNIEVKPGDRVKGGSSIIGRFDKDELQAGHNKPGSLGQ